MASKWLTQTDKSKLVNSFGFHTSWHKTRWWVGAKLGETYLYGIVTKRQVEHMKTDRFWTLDLNTEAFQHTKMSFPFIASLSGFCDVCSNCDGERSWHMFMFQAWNQPFSFYSGPLRTSLISQFFCLYFLLSLQLQNSVGSTYAQRNDWLLLLSLLSRRSRACVCLRWCGPQ